MNKKRPKHLDLRHIKLTVTGVVSLFHRLSGLMLFLAIPLILQTLAKSLESGDAYDSLASGNSSFLIKMFFLLCLWGLLHHFLSGLRLLALDFHLGVTLPMARKTAWWAFLGGIALTVLIGVKWW